MFATDHAVNQKRKLTNTVSDGRMVRFYIKNDSSLENHDSSLENDDFSLENDDFFP